MSRFVGCGIIYTAFTFGVLVRDAHIYVAGAGNSAGQAVISLAKEAAKVTMIVRGSDLERSMSAYLIQEIRHTSNIEILFDTEAIDAEGEVRLEKLVLQNTRTGETTKVDAHMFYVLIGAEPYTNWLDGCLEREKGYIVTSPSRTHSWQHSRNQFPFETSMPGVFAVGDVRYGSTKRVASAAGEGSVAVSSVHQYLEMLKASEDEPASQPTAAAVNV
jgi:thioredoxin reductase (NADPH)